MLECMNEFIFQNDFILPGGINMRRISRSLGLTPIPKAISKMKGRRASLMQLLGREIQ